MFSKSLHDLVSAVQCCSVLADGLNIVQPPQQQSGELDPRSLALSPCRPFPAFQCCTLKNTESLEWPVDEATPSPRLSHAYEG